MQKLPESSVASWTSRGTRSHPSLIDWFCSGCHRLVSISVPQWTSLGEPNFHGAGSCPGCRSKIQFFVLNQGTGHDSLAGGSLFMFPAGRVRTPISEVLENSELSDPLKGAYKSTVNVINSAEWNASAVLCRRLLEGITKTILPVELQKLSLHKQLSELPKHRDLAGPILELADAVRKGGNLGAHFDLEKEPDQHVATLMLELCEDLLQYLFVLPVRIQELHENIKKLGGNVAPEGDEGG
ncbi:DUF4145 domain-containing protein [Pseudoduganella eburnea]|uniref:DUF4145 domain-containing protein n=1 Tax=Massilia eburnea TaxID=1776165 RepID=A0A6L6QF52_9BURK|nr:DUF4145 domain-containing protein [Massilia eburnea]MTW10740.1 DUF4145 domain-containing protein [Massilia eburnea]